MGAVFNNYTGGNTYLIKGFFRSYTSAPSADVANPDIDGRVTITSLSAKHTFDSSTAKYKTESRTTVLNPIYAYYNLLDIINQLEITVNDNDLSA